MMDLKPNTRTLLVVVFFTILCGLSSGRLISEQPDLISDGFRASKLPQFLRFRSTVETCEQTYGFMPCTSTALGSLFLILVYGYLMFLAAKYLSDGSELLLEILGPGIVGGLFLPMLGALPDALLILVSGLSGSIETAQSQVSVGMGLLAGSTVMLLTVIWGTCIIVGKCDIQGGKAVNSQDTKGFSLTGSGISTDTHTSYAGMIMAVSVVPFIVVQVPQILHLNAGRHLAVLIGLIVSVLLLISYCLYQILEPWIQRRRLAYAKHKHVTAGVLNYLKTHSMERISEEDGKPNEYVLGQMFETLDVDKDGFLSPSEIKALIVGIQFKDLKMDPNVAVVDMIKDLDTSHDSKIDIDEFIHGIGGWLAEARAATLHPTNYVEEFHKQTRRDHDRLEEQTDEIAEGVNNSRWNSIKAALLLLLGTALAAAFADPLVDAVDNFSGATNIPTFFISFIVLPFATNSSEAVSAIIFASRKNIRSASLTFSEIYGSATMNNVLCLSVFLSLVYVRGLVWDFSSEVLVILIVCIVMGVFVSIQTTFPLWTSLLAFMLYPLSLVLVYVLDYIFGWS